MGSITNHIIDADLFAGSADIFRGINGGFWESVATDYGTSISLFETSTTAPGYTYFGSVLVSSSPETIDDSVMVPNKKIAIRITANEDEVTSDQQWRAIMIGGTYGETEYPGAYTESVFQYLNFTQDMPYSAVSATALSSDYASDKVQITYDYADYLPKYEKYINELDSELLIPNYYIMADLYGRESSLKTSLTSIYASELIEYISLESQYADFSELFTFNESALPGTTPDWELEMFGSKRQRNTNLSIDYLSSYLVQSSLSDSTTEWVESKLQTMLFDQEAIETFSNMDDYQDCLPFKVKIDFPAQAEYEFVDSINDNNLSQKLLKSLYEVFDNRIDTFTPTARNYIMSSNYYSGAIDSLVSYVQETEETSHREIDYVEFLSYCYNNYTDDNEEYMFVGEYNINRQAASETEPTYRHVNTRAVVGGLSDTVTFLEDVGVTEWDDLFANKERHFETIAYRVEKIGGAPTGDSATQNVLQNFWFINSRDMEEFKFYDNQVKYDTEYTYNIYAYVLAAGVKYGYSDLRITKQLGCTDSSEELVGLEFYDPNTNDGETVDRLYTDDSEDFSPLATTFASDAQIFSKYQYLADFYISYEPFTKIIEIPIYSKALKVLDNPSNVLNVKPYQVTDSSQKIGFDFLYNTFSRATFPSAISDTDATYKEYYMRGKDLLENSIVTQESISKPRYVEVYRLSERPTAITDFDGSLIQTLDLKIQNESKYTNSGTHYEAAIQANTKYYYLFRVLNQQRNLGHLTDIYETELVNDGGYLFAVFNLITESELEQKIPDTTAKAFKKIFQLQPNLSQLQFDTDAVDFDQSAISQIDNLTVGTTDDSIWNKTFKIRLTSKKTGKKIDLNITYKLSSDSDSAYSNQNKFTSMGSGFSKLNS